MKMVPLFRSKSCTLSRVTAANSLTLSSTSPPSPSLYQSAHGEEEEEEEEVDADDGYFGDNSSPVTTPFIAPEERRYRSQSGHDNKSANNNQQQYPILAVLVTALRKSLVTCSVERDDVTNMDISWPTEVRHVSHVTFDPFNGFLGLPVELQPEVPRKVPSASVSAFGVSAQSMQCSYDHRGNSVPTILLMMQNRLYSEGGLRAEGIFRINADNSQEENVRNQLNKGVVPCRIDVHCLAGLIKAWFRELPSGVLDCLKPEQVMHCNTEEECTELVNLLPTTEAALLDWAINLMADVVQHEQFNKMNARNIAMVFAPNMTKMADPLTALIHAVQVMNFLKTLIIKNLREREESAAMVGLLSSTAHSGNSMDIYSPDSGAVMPCQQDLEDQSKHTGNLLRSATLDRLESDRGEKFWSCRSEDDSSKESESVTNRFSPVVRRRQTLESRFRDGYESEEVEEGILEKLSLKKGMRKLCRHPVFQLSRPVKKNETVSIVNTRGDGEAWA